MRGWASVSLVRGSGVALLWCGMLLALVVTAGPAEPPEMLLADDARPVRVAVGWPMRDGSTATLGGERRWRSAADKSLLGRNIECYAALGGTRLDKACGDRDGAVVLVGLYKVDTRRPFFEGMADDGAVNIRIDGVRMNQPAVARPVTGLVHVRYMLDDLASCGISADGRNLYITAAADDCIVNRVAADSVRPGGLRGGAAGVGSVRAETGADGSVSIEFRIPYALLRHLKDPSRRVVPGGFFEPQHFHCEVELLPTAVAAAQDAKEISPDPAPAGREPPSAPPGR
ncbi:MAG: hypothetical protein WD749_03565 [Phycisphaerales bacterium]